MKFRSLIFLVLSLTILSCNGQSVTNAKVIEAKDFFEKINAAQNLQLLDVRTPEEFAAEHIDNAKNVNWLGDTFILDAEKFDKTKPLFIYCKSGSRSKLAGKKLEELGFTTIYELEGGFLKWSAEGLNKPLDKVVGMSSQEYQELVNTDKTVLVDFYADWCAPCKEMAPYLKKMETELAGNVIIIRLDADKNKTLMSEMKIDVLPTLLLYKNKEVKWTHSGFISEKDLRKQL